MSPLTGYRRLFGLTGPLYVVVGFLARLPLAMSQLGVLLLVAGTTDSYGAGGACAGALAIANAVCAPAWGTWADRVGQRPVVLIQSVAGAAAVVLLLVVAHSDLHWAWAGVASAIAGALMPQVGPMARVRWRPITARHEHQKKLVDIAFSYEGAADEASFVLGPALIGLGVSVASPTIALASAAGVLAVFGAWFALHETATITHAARETTAAGVTRLLTPALLVLCVAQLVIGTIFGSVQTGTSVLATEVGQPGLTGYFHALLGIGSVVAGLSMAALPERFGLPARMRWFAVGLLVLALPLLLVDSLGMLAPVLLILGLCIAPFMITTFTIGERITPRSRTGAAMTMLAAATGLGYAIGAAVAGQLADWGGQTPAFAVTVGAGVVATLLSWSCARMLGRAESRAAEPSTGRGIDVGAVELGEQDGTVQV